MFADDEPSLQELMKLELPRLGHRVTVCPDGVTAVAALEKNTYDCIIVDLDMPGLDGIGVIAQVQGDVAGDRGVVLTGKSSLDTAIAALRHGAFDYLTKPCRLIEIEALLKRVAEKKRLEQKNRALEHQVRRLEGTPRLIGSTPAMHKVRLLIEQVAPTGSTVLVLGETGTGKELVARSLHDHSTRADMPFVAVNCGGLPETLIESELFGHRKGAFTGADEHRVGPVRSRPRRHDLPRRNRRAAQGDAGQAAARAGERRDPPRRREQAGDRRRARGVRHAPQPAGDGRRGGFPRRPDVPHQHVRDPLAAAARADRRRAGARPAPAGPASPRRQGRASR